MKNQADLSGNMNDKKEKVTIGYFWEVRKNRDGKKSYFKNLSIFLAYELRHTSTPKKGSFMFSHAEQFFFRASFN
jgi:hypothetical protein